MARNEFLLVLGMTLVTFAVRYPVMALVSKITLPPSVLAALRYIPPAVLTAIIVPSLLAPDGDTLQLGLNNAYLAAGIVAALIAWRTNNLLLTILLGMGSFWAWRWLLA